MLQWKQQIEDKGVVMASGKGFLNELIAKLSSEELKQTKKKQLTSGRVKAFLDGGNITCNSLIQERASRVQGIKGDSSGWSLVSK